MDIRRSKTNKIWAFLYLPNWEKVISSIGEKVTAMSETRDGVSTCDGWRVDALQAMVECGHFTISVAEIDFFNNVSSSIEERNAALSSAGGVGGLLESLKSDDKGLAASDESEARRAAFGVNSMPAPEEETWLSLFAAAFEDTTHGRGVANTTKSRKVSL